jgi:transposase
MDVSLDGSTDGFAGRIEILEDRSGRRFWIEGERARIAAESLVPGVRVADVARRHEVTRWQVYDWRKKLKAGVLALPAETAKELVFAALVVEPKPTRPSRHPKKRGVKAKPGKIELVVDGVTLRVSADIDDAQLTRTIRAIRAASA